MKQASRFDGLLFDHFSLFQDGLPIAGTEIKGRDDVVQQRRRLADFAFTLPWGNEAGPMDGSTNISFIQKASKVRSMSVHK